MIQRTPMSLWLVSTLAGRRRLAWAMLTSALLHAAFLASSHPAAPREPETLRALTVIIAPPAPDVRPDKAHRVAQANSEGGDRALRASNARAARSPEVPPVVAKAQQNVASLERKVDTLRQLADASDLQLPASRAEPTPQTPQGAGQPVAPPKTFNRAELLSQGSRIARLETEIARDAESYQRRPRRKVFGATAVGVNYARYVEDWRLKVEGIGNLNYPQKAREQNLSGTLQVLVALRADGSVERIELLRSSGHDILDAAAERIVMLGAPYAPFPESLSRDTDILEIVRTWTFSRDQRLHAESAQ
ncbi:MAG: TonB family protein [Rhodocyclaceae bacterium]|nr:TonB family protein [Rhodocyclaceae bacterium]